MLPPTAAERTARIAVSISDGCCGGQTEEGFNHRTRGFTEDVGVEGFPPWKLCVLYGEALERGLFEFGHFLPMSEQNDIVERSQNYS